MNRLWLVFSLTAGPSARDPWFAGDKLQHFFTSAFVQSMSYASLRTSGLSHTASLAGASATTAVIGVGKEVHDRHVKGDLSLRDLAWDAAGAGAATVLLVRTRR